MPFNGDPQDFVSYATDNPEEIEQQLSVWAMEWLEVNCVSWRWWTPTRRTLAEIFAVDPGHDAASVTKAYEHFDAHPKDRNVADLEERGDRGLVKFSVVRTPFSDVYTEYWGIHNKSFWSWFDFRMRQLSDRLDARMINIVRSISSRIQHIDVSDDPSLSRLKQSAYLLTMRAGWLLHEAAAAKVTGGPLNVYTLGAPVTVAGLSPRSERGELRVPSNEFSPSTCIIRDENFGFHFTVADSMRVKVRPIDGTSAQLDLDIWSGIGVDITNQKAKALTFDVGVREGI